MISQSFPLLHLKKKSKNNFHIYFWPITFLISESQIQFVKLRFRPTSRTYFPVDVVKLYSRKIIGRSPLRREIHVLPRGREIFRMALDPSWKNCSVSVLHSNVKFVVVIFSLWCKSHTSLKRQKTCHGGLVSHQTVGLSAYRWNSDILSPLLR